jgi:nicotinamidase-related amidase
MKRIDLFVVDGQNDFCVSGNEPADWPWPGGKPQRGALFVEGADKEGVLVGEMIDRLTKTFKKIHATLDSHHRLDGSHNVSWKGTNGKAPPPFTVVSHQDVKDQKWVPRFSLGVWEGKAIPSYQWALKYTESLEKNGRCPLCLWPPHCQIGTWGQCVYHPLQQAYDRWCEATAGWINWISKGQWVWTEHYSGLRADVPDPTRPETQMNVAVVQDVMEAEQIAWVGWAGSHCLRWTALDAVNYFGQGSNEFIRKSVFFEDASAAVPDIPGAPFKFSDWRKEFLAEVKQRGAAITTTKEFLK